MRKKIIYTAKQAVKEACFVVFDATIAVWDFVAWMKEDSALSGWLGVVMMILCACEVYFFKDTWERFRALCAEIKD